MLVALHDISIRSEEGISFPHTTWTIGSGECWAIVGPTGSGKTTLARAVTRQVSLTGGRITYHFDAFERSYLLPGEILTFSSETHRAFLQGYAAYHQARWQSFEGEDAPTVRALLGKESIFKRSPFETLSPVERKAFECQKQALIDLFGLDELLARKIHLLSHGESRKVFLTRLLLRSPRLLILDDPYAGLDAEMRRRFQEAVHRILEEGKPPVLLVTSRVEDLPPAVTHLLVVENHQVIRQGKRQAIEPGLENARAPHPSETGQPTRAEQESSTKFAALVEQYAARLSGGVLPADGALVEMKNVCVSYRQNQVLKNVTWSVRNGERWILSGANGAGKSTLLSLILADHPQAYVNEIRLFGRQRGSGESIWEIKKKIGWVSPELQIYYSQEAQALDVVGSGYFHSIGLYQSCSPEQRTISLDWMKALGIAALAEHPFANLSTGQQRLVLLARALVREPPLLILDEPCQGLDEPNRRAFVDIIDRLCARAPLTLIYVTHDAGELPAAITHRLHLDRGEVISP